MNCPKCNSPTRMDVDATISAPGELEHRFSKANIRRKDVYLIGVSWDAANFYCTNPECRYVYSGYTNHVYKLRTLSNELEGVLDLLETKQLTDSDALDSFIKIAQRAKELNK